MPTRSPPWPRAGRSGSTPSCVGVGIDAVDLERFAPVLGRRPAVADRLFTPGELAYARSAPDPVPRLSTRFAAKEAVMKALGVGLWAYPFHDVEVVRDGLDAPGLVLSGAADGPRPPLWRDGRWHLSLSHTDQVALALVVAEGGPARRRAAGLRSGARVVGRLAGDALASRRCSRSSPSPRCPPSTRQALDRPRSTPWSAGPARRGRGRPRPHGRGLRPTGGGGGRARQQRGRRPGGRRPSSAAGGRGSG